jgi:hypothetical protein
VQKRKNRHGYGGFCFPAAPNVQLIDPAPLSETLPSRARMRKPDFARVAVKAGIGPTVWQFVNRGRV